MSNCNLTELGELIDSTKGGGTPSRKVPDFWNGNILWASVKDLKDEKLLLENTVERISKEGLNNSSSNLITPYTPIICVRMAVGRIAYSKEPLAINQDLKALVPKEDIDFEYLVYLLNFHQKRIEAKAIGSTVKGISTMDLLRTRVHFINSPIQQRKIAHILSTVDRIIERTEAAIAKYEAIKQGLMQDLFTRGIDPATGRLRPPLEEAPELYKETEAGWVPGEWEVVAIGELGEWAGGMTPSKLKPEYWKDGRTLWVSPKDLTSNRIIDSEDKISNSALRDCSLRVFSPENSLIVVFRSGILKHSFPICTCSKPFTVNQDLKVLAVSNSALRDYIFKYLEFLKPLFLKTAVKIGTTVESVDGGTFFKVKIGIPLFQEYEKINLKLNNLDNKIEYEKKYCEKLKKLKQALMQDLLTGKVEVK